MSNVDKAHEAIMFECDKTHIHISQLFTVLHRSIGFFLPIAIGIVLLSNKIGELISQNMVAFFLSGFFAFATIYSNLIWIELLSHFRHLYCELYPDLHKISNIDRENLGQGIVERYGRGYKAAIILFHLVQFTLVVPISLSWAFTNPKEIYLIVGTLFFHCSAIFGLIQAARETKYTTIELKKSSGQ